MRVDKNEVKRLYIKGYNAKEISNILYERNNENTKSDTIQKCINRNFSELKSEHRKARDSNKKIKRAIDIKNNAYMSNHSLLKYNRQSYSYNQNGNLVFNNKGGKKPADIPKTFYKTKI